MYPQLKTRFIDSGEANLTFVNYPVIGIPSVYAAMASEYVFRENPDQWQEFTKDLYDIQTTLSNQRISELAVQYVDGVTAEEIQEMLEIEQMYIDDVLADYNKGDELGVTGTPYLVINGQAVNHSDLGAIETIVNKIASGEQE
ncbi:thioredoxin domain-containing protein [Bacillus sp. B15-48]|nr:thioredoxin domain-containing protein [Bacillus sp. B15-48]